MKFVHPYNFKFDLKIHASKNPNKSVTVPDMHITVREMLARYVTGGDMPKGNVGYYDPDATFEDAFEYDNDLVDMKMNAESVRSLRNAIKEEMEKKKDVEVKDDFTPDSSKNSKETT